jgi:hypothetical protein
MNVIPVRVLAYPQHRAFQQPKTAEGASAKE